MPPPKIRRNIPKIITKVHNDFDFGDSAILLLIKPINAKGITSQFNQPNSGKKANTIPNKQSVEIIKATIFILFHF